jgi:hypothetical protein
VNPPATKSYTIKQLAEELNCSYNYARRLALEEIGVLRIPSAGGKRSTTRIPAAVVERILRKYAITRPPE